MRTVLASLVELGGAVALVYGLWLLAPWLAFVVGGLLAVVAAQTVEKGDQ